MSIILALFDLPPPKSDLFDFLGHSLWPGVALLFIWIFHRQIVEVIESISFFLRRLTKAKLGPFEGEAKQGEEEAPPPSANLQANIEPIPQENKILATLWKYQKLHCGNDLGKRWTFKVSPTSPAYVEYLTGLASGIRNGLITVSPETEQCMLTNAGITYSEQQHVNLEGLPKYDNFG